MESHISPFKYNSRLTVIQQNAAFDHCKKLLDVITMARHMKADPKIDPAKNEVTVFVNGIAIYKASFTLTKRGQFKENK